MPARIPFAPTLTLLAATACGVASAMAMQACGDAGALARRDHSRSFAAARGTKGLLTLMYHDILDCSFGRPAGMVADDVCLSDLEAHMDALLSRGYRTVDLATVIDARASGRSLPAKSLLVTFDDNYFGATSRGLPALARRKMKATVFAHTGYVRPEGTPIATVEANWRAARHPKASYREMVDAELSAGGALFRYESHTITHRNLTSLPAAQAATELAGSKAALEAGFKAELAARGRRYADAVPSARFVDASGNKRVVGLAYPYGGLNAAVHAATRAAGYAMAFEVGYDETHGNEAFAMPRMGVGKSITNVAAFMASVRNFEARTR